MAVVGIDLGTTNTVVGVTRDGQATALRDPDGEYLIPSVVSFHPNGTVLVGRAAKERRVVDAANTIYSIKRLIGRSWSSEEVATARARFPFEMREGPGQAALVVARGETFTLPEISAFVLRHAKGVAEKALGEPVDRAVITVPANFNDLQRAATKVAGRVAGLEVMRILNEPTAAALAYGYGKGTQAERIAIYDFGGGTFDVTLLDLSGNVFEVLATAGNTFLGGDDIDLVIAERMAEQCRQKLGIDAHADAQIFERLRYHAERLKVELSTAETSTVDVPDVGRGKRLTFTMSRRDLEALAGPIVERTFGVCEEALAISRLEARAFDHVVLVGGSTRLPIVRDRVRQYFGQTPLDRINPDEVVAIGAGIQASALTGQDRRRSVIPRPPMPAARSLEGAVGARPPSSRPAAGAPGERRRVITGLGIGPVPGVAGRPSRPPLPPKAAPAPSPVRVTSGTSPSRRPPPPRKGGTLGGLGAPNPLSAPPPLPPAARAPSLTDLRATDPLDTDEDLTRPIGSAPPPPLEPATDVDADFELMDDDEPTGLHHRAVTLDGGFPAPDPSGFVDEELTQVGTPTDLMLAASRPEGTAMPDEAPPSSAGDRRISTDSLPPALRFPAPASEPRAAPAPTARTTPASSPLSSPEGRRPPLKPPPERSTAARPPALDPVDAPPSSAARPPPPQTSVAPAGTKRVPLKPPPERYTPAERPSVAELDPSMGVSRPPIVPPIVEPPAAPIAGPPAVAPFAPAAPEPRILAPSTSRGPRPSLPLLVDVTPLSLCVETAGGYRDVIIPRNTPVPCESSRTFVTAQHQQETVRVRVGQGEEQRFQDDTLLGELELAGLRAAPRGEVQIVVTFALDTDGMLEVRATDAGTGKASSARLRLVGLPDAEEVGRLTERHQRHRAS